MRTLEEHMCHCQSTVAVGTLWFFFSIKKIKMGEASITDTEPPRDNGIFTTETILGLL